MQKYTGDILHIHINTLYSLHSHEASSFWADFSQTRAKVKIEENRRERSPNIHSAVLATDYVPKKTAVRNKTVSQETHLCFHILSTSPARGEGVSKRMVTHTGCSGSTDDI